MGAVKMRSVQVGSVRISLGGPLTVIAGPCVAESLEMCLRVGEAMRRACAAAGLGYIFKASFDKANRTSLGSQRGPGMDRALGWLAQVRAELGVPVTTDIHEPDQAGAVAEVVDLLQIPAFLCRQTDLLAAAARTGKPVNVKKGQFLSPAEMRSVVEKLVQSAKPPAARRSSAKLPGVILTERGTFFGYHRLVNDFVGLGDLMELGWPVCFDVTHSTQLPGAGAGESAAARGRAGLRVTSGRPERAALLARCAVAAGVQAVFLETHPDPKRAMSDAATQLPVAQAVKLVKELARLRQAMA